MKNITLIGFFFFAPLQAMDYHSLLKKAIQNNSTLEISQNNRKQKHLEMQISTRVENPSITMEVSSFSAEFPLQNNRFGARVGVSQSLLFPSLKRDKRALGEQHILLLTERYRLEKSEFKYRFSMRYLAYKKSVLLHNLTIEALGISQNIMHIAKKRYEQGTGLKSDYLETKIADKNLHSHEKRLAFSRQKSLNTLKIMANIKGDLTLNHRYHFHLNTRQYLHPLLALTQKQKALIKAKLKIASHSIESYEIFSEIESEPDAEVFRIGISIALPIFHDKSEEKQLLKLEQSNQRLRLANQEKALHIELKNLKEENTLLKEMLQEYTSLRDEQNALLKIYQKGYRIAKINLVALEMTKQSFINNQEEIIKTNINIEENIIRMNYLKGEKDD